LGEFLEPWGLNLPISWSTKITPGIVYPVFLSQRKSFISTFDRFFHLKGLFNFTPLDWGQLKRLAGKLDQVGLPSGKKARYNLFHQTVLGKLWPICAEKCAL